MALVWEPKTQVPRDRDVRVEPKAGVGLALTSVT